MDFDKKPGSRDGEPYKGRRKKAVAVGPKDHSVRVLPADEIDSLQLRYRWSDRNKAREGAKTNEYGMLEGVSYSLNKDGRWKIIEELKKRDDDEILVAEFDNLDSSTGTAREQLSNAMKARKAKESEAEEEHHSGRNKDFSGKLKKEKTQSKRAQRKNQSRKEDAEQRAEATEIKQVYIVEKSLSRKEIQNSKQLVCDGGRGTGCGCRYCKRSAECDPARVNKKIDAQREVGLK
jgi:hypothetical protein